MQACGLHLEDHNLAVDVVSEKLVINKNGIGSCSVDTMVRFIHIVAKIFDVLPGFVREPHFCRAYKSVQTAEELAYWYFFMMVQKTLVPESSCPRYFSMIYQRSIVMGVSTAILIQVILLQLKFQIERQFPVPPPVPLVVRVWTHIETFPSSATPNSSRR